MVEQIGKRIKMKRESLGFPMKELSDRIGVTPSLISQIERGKAFPSIVTLKKISEVLHTTVGELIGENEDLVHRPLLKSSERRFVRKNKNGTSLYLLSRHDPAKQIEPYIIQFSKNSDSESIMTSNYPGQEFCFILIGQFEALVNEQEYELHEGDGFYFDSAQPHYFRNVSSEKAEILWIITPNRNV